MILPPIRFSGIRCGTQGQRYYLDQVISCATFMQRLKLYKRWSDNVSWINLMKITYLIISCFLGLDKGEACQLSLTTSFLDDQKDAWAIRVLHCPPFTLDVVSLHPSWFHLSQCVSLHYLQLSMAGLGTPVALWKNTHYFYFWRTDGACRNHKYKASHAAQEVGCKAKIKHPGIFQNKRSCI